MFCCAQLPHSESQQRVPNLRTTRSVNNFDSKVAESNGYKIHLPHSNQCQVKTVYAYLSLKIPALLIKTNINLILLNIDFTSVYFEPKCTPNVEQSQNNPTDVNFLKSTTHNRPTSTVNILKKHLTLCTSLNPPLPNRYKRRYLSLNVGLSLNLKKHWIKPEFN